MSLEAILLLVILGVVIAIFFLRNRNSSGSDSLLVQLNEALRNEIQEIRKDVAQNAQTSRLEIEGKLKTINQEINEFQKSAKQNMQQQFSQSNKIVKEVTSELEKIKGTNEQVLNFATQMKSLEKILGNSKQRGILGEIQLENLLANVLPPDLFSMQHMFTNGEIVDAIVKVGQFIIPIDAKFSLDNYNKMIESSDPNEIKTLETQFRKDIRSRIDETAKYIRPNEQTTDYAYMFIPADGLYQDLLNSRVGSLKINSRDLVSYAYDKKVMIVSPMSLFPMLQITVKALHNLKIEKSVQEILANVDKLTKHLNAYQAYHTKLGKTLVTAVNHYNDLTGEFRKIDKDIIRLSPENKRLTLDTDEVSKPNVLESEN